MRTHQVAVGAFERAGDPGWYPAQLVEGGAAPWTPLKLYEQAIPASVRTAMNDRMRELGMTSPWMAPDGATEEEARAWLAASGRMLVPDEEVTTWVDISAQLERKWNAVMEHVTQIGPESMFMRFGLDGWRTFWAREAYVLRESRVPASTPESDLFAGI
jgi:mycothiol S-conjugate amidase